MHSALFVIWTIAVALLLRLQFTFVVPFFAVHLHRLGYSFVMFGPFGTQKQQQLISTSPPKINAPFSYNGHRRRENHIKELANFHRISCYCFEFSFELSWQTSMKNFDFKIL